MERDRLAVAGWVVVLTVALLGLISLGDGPLSAPPLTEPSAWAGWATTRPPLHVAFAVLRLVVLGLAWYLLGVLLVGLALRLLRAARLVAVADVVTVPAVRRLLQGALGLGLATAAVTSVGTVRPPAPAPAVVIALPHPAADLLPVGTGGTATMRHTGTAEDPAPPQIGPPSTRPWVTRDAAPDDPLQGLQPHQEAAPDDPDQPEQPDQGTAHGTGAAAPMEEAGPGREWTVRSGQHFWGIAEQVLEEARQGPVSDTEILPYWEALVEANRDRLADPGNPDLLYPGQVLAVPELGQS